MGNGKRYKLIQFALSKGAFKMIAAESAHSPIGKTPEITGEILEDRKRGIVRQSVFCGETSPSTVIHSAQAGLSRGKPKGVFSIFIDGIYRCVCEMTGSGDMVEGLPVKAERAQSVCADPKAFP